MIYLDTVAFCYVRMLIPLPQLPHSDKEMRAVNAGQFMTPEQFGVAVTCIREVPHYIWRGLPALLGFPWFHSLRPVD
jgi:hypothetical protein